MATGPDEVGTVGKLLAGLAALATALGLGPVIRSWLKRRKPDIVQSDSKIEKLLVERIEDLEGQLVDSRRRQQEGTQHLLAALQDVAVLRERHASAAKEIDRLTGELGRLLADQAALRTENRLLNEQIHSIRHTSQLQSIGEAIRKANEQDRSGT